MHAAFPLHWLRYPTSHYQASLVYSMCMAMMSILSASFPLSHSESSTTSFPLSLTQSLLPQASPSHSLSVHCHKLPPLTHSSVHCHKLPPLTHSSVHCHKLPPLTHSVSTTTSFPLTHSVSPTTSFPLSLTQCPLPQLPPLTQCPLPQASPSHSLSVHYHKLPPHLLSVHYHKLPPHSLNPSLPPLPSPPLLSHHTSTEELPSIHLRSSYLCVRSSQEVLPYKSPSMDLPINLY